MVLACLLLCALPAAGAQAPGKSLDYLGASQLDRLAADAISSDDLQVSPHPESDAELAGINRGPGSASIPVISKTQPVTAATNDLLLAFEGITHRQQRFAGTGAYANTQFSTEPPDEGLAVGNGFVLQTVNAALAVYDSQTGALIDGPTALNQFFRLKPEIDRGTGAYGDFTSDPRAYYDPQLQRWFVTVVAIATNPNSGEFQAPTRLLIAVSDSNDPTQTWKIYSLETTQDGRAGCPCFGDQPLIGANAHGLFITTNAFSLREGFAGVQIYAASKQLLAAGEAPTVQHWNGVSLPGGFAFSVQPARQVSSPADDSSGTEYFTGIADIRNMLDARIAVWSLSNTSSLPDATARLKLQSTIVNSEPFGVPPDAAQKLGATELGSLLSENQQFIETNDQRMQQAVFADGKLWSALTTIVAIGNDPTPHAGIAYFSLVPSAGPDGKLKAQIVQQGYIAVAGADVFYPALGMAANGKGAIAFTLSGSQYYPSTGFSLLDERGAGPVQIVAAGFAPQDGFSGYKYFGGGGSGRSGDYSAATVDEQGGIWIASEYIPSGPRTLLANWGTFIARVAAK